MNEMSDIELFEFVLSIRILISVLTFFHCVHFIDNEMY